MGWLYPTLPKQYGGADLEVEKTVILYDEMARAFRASFGDATAAAELPRVVRFGS